VVDSQTAPFIKKMFELYASGDYSLHKLRKEIVAQGFIYRNGKNFHKSTLDHILKNEFYTGVFYWKGKKYENAKHQALVDMTLFQKVQNTLLNPRQSKSKKGIFAFTNLISCGYCNGSLTAEIKKGKYIYYRCSQHSENHGQKYLKEHEIENEFGKVLQSINLTDRQKQDVLKGLQESLKDKIAFHDHSIKALNERIKVLQSRIDKAYSDKLDGKITESFWVENNTKWQIEKDELSIKLQAHQKADRNYFENADLILELAKKAHYLFMKQKPEEKRRLINLIVSALPQIRGQIALYNRYCKMTKGERDALRTKFTQN
jgi:hypothetical protein